MKGKNRNRQAVEWYIDRYLDREHTDVYICPHFKNSRDIFGLFDAILKCDKDTYYLAITHRNNLAKIKSRLKEYREFIRKYPTTDVPALILFSKKKRKIVFEDRSDIFYFENQKSI